MLFRRCDHPSPKLDGGGGQGIDQTEKLDPFTSDRTNKQRVCKYIYKKEIAETAFLFNQI